MDGVGGAPLLLQRIRGSSAGSVTAQRGTEDGQMDTVGLGGRSSGSGEGIGHAAGAIWHMNKGSPIWEDWAFSLVEGGQGGVM